MIIFLIALVIIICTGIKFSGKKDFFRDYCSPKDTGMINGIFSVLIFLSHSSGYITLDSPFDTPYRFIFRLLGQFVVATYLFYSGFGIMSSYKKKGTDYIKSMPVNRLFKTWYHFAIVVIVYLVLSLGVLGKNFKISRILLSFTGLTSAGNSNWYMFVTFALYILLIVAFLIFKKSTVIATSVFTLLVIGLVVVEYSAGLPTRFYNTIFCFPAGMIFSLLKPEIDKLLMKKNRNWLIGVACSLAIFVVCALTRRMSIVIYNLFAISGVVFISVLSMKIRVDNKILGWFSNHIFSFFILQRIPMMLLRATGLNKNPYVFVIICFVITIILSVLFDKLTDKLDSLIFKKPQKNKDKIKV